MARKKAPEIELPLAGAPRAVQSKPKMKALAAAAQSKAPPAKTKGPAIPKKISPVKAKQIETTHGRSILNLNDAVNGSVTDDQIAERAYFHWLERGCPFGSPEEDWLYAEQELGRLR